MVFSAEKITAAPSPIDPFGKAVEQLLGPLIGIVPIATIAATLLWLSGILFWMTTGSRRAMRSCIALGAMVILVPICPLLFRVLLPASEGANPAPDIAPTYDGTPIFALVAKGIVAVIGSIIFLFCVLYLGRWLVGCRNRILQIRANAAAAERKRLEAHEHANRRCLAGVPYALEEGVVTIDDLQRREPDELQAIIDMGVANLIGDVFFQTKQGVESLRSQQGILNRKDRRRLDAMTALLDEMYRVPHQVRLRALGPIHDETIKDARKALRNVRELPEG